MNENKDRTPVLRRCSFVLYEGDPVDIALSEAFGKVRNRHLAGFIKNVLYSALCQNTGQDGTTMPPMKYFASAPSSHIRTEARSTQTVYTPEAQNHDVPRQMPPSPAATPIVVPAPIAASATVAAPASAAPKQGPPPLPKRNPALVAQPVEKSKLSADSVGLNVIHAAQGEIPVEQEDADGSLMNIFV